MAPLTAGVEAKGTDLCTYSSCISLIKVCFIWKKSDLKIGVLFSYLLLSLVLSTPVLSLLIPALLPRLLPRPLDLEDRWAAAVMGGDSTSPEPRLEASNSKEPCQNMSAFTRAGQYKYFSYFTDCF